MTCNPKVYEGGGRFCKKKQEGSTYQSLYRSTTFVRIDLGMVQIKIGYNYAAPDHFFSFVH
jgi:hypothetical protein